MHKRNRLVLTAIAVLLGGAWFGLKLRESMRPWVTVEPPNGGFIAQFPSTPVASNEMLDLGNGLHVQQNLLECKSGSLQYLVAWAS